MPCAVAEYQCGRVCSKVLGCGRHRCERVCHAGACGGCPSAGLRRCPCGKVLFGAWSSRRPHRHARTFMHDYAIDTCRQM